ncbi:hypothetical protein M8J76_007602 [Diaphorina citri]|nr:hypothetical protein M8J76_007602 [Diaphorina citri]
MELHKVTVLLHQDVQCEALLFLRHYILSLRFFSPIPTQQYQQLAAWHAWNTPLRGSGLRPHKETSEPGPCFRSPCPKGVLGNEFVTIDLHLSRDVNLEQKM